MPPAITNKTAAFKTEESNMVVALPAAKRRKTGASTSRTSRASETSDTTVKSRDDVAAAVNDDADTDMSDAETAQSPHRLDPDYGPYSLLTVVVGETKVEFAVHKKLLIEKSSYFEAACSTAWKEGQEGIVRLEAEDPAIFKIFLRWIYTGDIDHSLIEKEVPDSEPEEVCPHYPELTDLYILAQYLQTPKLINQICDDFIERRRKFNTLLPGASALSSVWEKAPAGCGLQRMLKGMMYNAKVADFKEEAKDWPKGLLIELMSLHYDGAEGKDCDPVDKESCQWHDHEEDEHTCDAPSYADLARMVAAKK